MGHRAEKGNAMSATENRAAANLAVVTSVYEAFGRGEIGVILDQIADDCAWESWLDNYGQKAGPPPMQPRHGAPASPSSSTTWRRCRSRTSRCSTCSPGRREGSDLDRDARRR